MSANNNKPDVSKIKDFDLEKIQQELQQFIRNSEKLDSNNIREEASIFLEKIVNFNKNQRKFICFIFCSLAVAALMTIQYVIVLLVLFPPI